FAGKPRSYGLSVPPQNPVPATLAVQRSDLPPSRASRIAAPLAPTSSFVQAKKSCPGGQQEKHAMYGASIAAPRLQNNDERIGATRSGAQSDRWFQ
ncbi:hypothetical protein, partial [Pseudomonas sp. NPDC089569]|uniref:hypothetical protein n=1 Tax=Pseudomonas sp. NPDC089569 TaxID=3390722 RepID=UPI003D004523